MISRTDRFFYDHRQVSSKHFLVPGPEKISLFSWEKIIIRFSHQFFTGGTQQMLSCPVYTFESKIGTIFHEDHVWNIIIDSACKQVCTMSFAYCFLSLFNFV